MLKKYVSLLLSGALIFTSLSFTPSIAYAESTEVIESVEDPEISSETKEIEETEEIEESEDTEITEKVDTEETSETEEVSSETEEEEPEEEPVTHKNGYAPVIINIENADEKISNTQGRIQAYNAVSIPTYFSSVSEQISLYPSTRDQNPYGSCWAHGSLGMMEYDLIKQGVKTKTVDFSEFHLAYFASRMPYTLLSGMSGDSVYAEPDTSENETIFDIGSNYHFSANALATGLGPVNSSSFLSDSNFLAGNVSNAYAFSNQSAELKSAYCIDGIKTNSTQTKIMKEAIMTYGSVGVYFWASDNMVQGTNAFTYPGTSTTGYAYYLGDTTAANHAVMIVGWDDDFSISNFCGSKIPSKKGAWLVRNSWSTTAENDPYSYFWMSYEEPSLQDEAWVFEAQARPSTRYTYQYDGSYYGLFLYDDYNNKAYSAITLKARDVSSDKKEVLNAVSISSMYFINNSGTIYVYENPTSGNPESGTLVAQQSFEYAETGIYSVELSKPVGLVAGRQYSIVIISEYPIDFEISANNYSGNNQTAYNFVAAPSGNSYYKDSDGKWYNSSLINSREGRSGFGDAKIKALTSLVNYYDLSIDQQNVSMTIGDTTTLTATVSGLGTDPTVEWSSSNPAVATVSDNGLVTAVSAGTTYIRINVAGYTAATKVTVKSPYVAETKVSLSKTSISLKTGGTYTLKATVAPTNATNKTVKWSSSNTSIASVSSAGKVTAKAPGTATITATTTNGKKATCKVTVTLATTTAKATVAGKTSIKLTWTKVTGAAGYYIYRSTSAKSFPSKPTKTISSGSTVSFTNTGLTFGKKYYYKIVAYKSSSKSGYSNVVSATPTLIAPTISTSASCTSSSITIKWGKISDATGYEIYRKSSSSGKWSKIKTISGASTVSYKDTKATATSYYRIRSTGKNGKKTIYSDYSAQVVTKKLGTTAAKLTSSSGTDKISWSAVTGATGYVVYYKISSSGSWTKLTSTTGKSYSRTNVPHGKRYYYAVKPYYKNGSAYTYGALGSTTIGHLWFCKPEAYFGVDSKTDDNILWIHYTNYAGHAVTIYDQNAQLYDSGYNNGYIVDCSLLDTNGNYKSSITIPAGDDVWIGFEHDWLYDENCYIYFEFKIDGVKCYYFGNAKGFIWKEL